jgi:hypothetical protein
MNPHEADHLIASHGDRDSSNEGRVSCTPRLGNCITVRIRAGMSHVLLADDLEIICVKMKISPDRESLL